MEKLSGWGEAIILKLPNLFVAIFVMVSFYFLAKGISKASRKYLFDKIKQESIKDLSTKFVFGFIILIGFFLALGIMDLDKVLTSVLAGAGVVGLAVGLAVQATLSNSVSGIMLSFIPSLRIGDYVETNGYSGFISEINLRSIILRRPDNNYVIIPNSKIVDNPFTNYSLTERSRIGVECGIGYESNLQHVEDLVKDIIGNEFKQNEGEGVEFFFTEFGDSSINFVVRFWIDFKKNKHQLEAKHKAMKLIKQKFDEEGINIPFPIRTLYFDKDILNN
ncbi:mechanosensitive ion channel family protein [Algibacter sp. 2305UL17-15]|uniref:mechanosensitive ion channel family protein n=1 Tax=Algibacter sp. 2305UL17-15 TaxID=3231268 RepID=UPI0034579F95